MIRQDIGGHGLSAELSAGLRTGLRIGLCVVLSTGLPVADVWADGPHGWRSFATERAAERAADRAAERERRRDARDEIGEQHQSGQRLSPDERRQLRRDIRDAGRELYPPRRDRRH